MSKNDYMSNTKRKDLVKYKGKTRIISFSCDDRYAGSGSDARKALQQLFGHLVDSLTKTQFANFKKLYFIQIDNVNKILALDIMKENE